MNMYVAKIWRISKENIKTKSQLIVNWNISYLYMLLINFITQYKNIQSSSCKNLVTETIERITLIIIFACGPYSLGQQCPRGNTDC